MRPPHRSICSLPGISEDQEAERIEEEKMELELEASKPMEIVLFPPLEPILGEPPANAVELSQFAILPNELIARILTDPALPPENDIPAMLTCKLFHQFAGKRFNGHVEKVFIQNDIIAYKTVTSAPYIQCLLKKRWPFLRCKIRYLDLKAPDQAFWRLSFGRIKAVNIRISYCSQVWDKEHQQIINLMAAIAEMDPDRIFIGKGISLKLYWYLKYRFGERVEFDPLLEEALVNRYMGSEQRAAPHGDPQRRFMHLMVENSRRNHSWFKWRYEVIKPKEQTKAINGSKARDIVKCELTIEMTEANLLYFVQASGLDLTMDEWAELFIKVLDEMKFDTIVFDFLFPELYTLALNRYTEKISILDVLTENELPLMTRMKTLVIDFIDVPNISKLLNKCVKQWVRGDMTGICWQINLDEPLDEDTIVYGIECHFAVGITERAVYRDRYELVISMEDDRVILQDYPMPYKARQMVDRMFAIEAGEDPDNDDDLPGEYNLWWPPKEDEEDEEKKKEEEAKAAKAKEHANSNSIFASLAPLDASIWGPSTSAS